jgi:uncharacterized protein YndB with AHSA1/START domain
MARWLPPNGFTCTVHQMHSKVGGTYRMSFTNFTTGKTRTFDGKYLDLIPDELIRYTDRFDDPNLLDEMITTVTLQPVLLVEPERLAISRERRRSLEALYSLRTLSNVKGNRSAPSLSVRVTCPHSTQTKRSEPTTCVSAIPGAQSCKC